MSVEIVIHKIDSKGENTFTTSGSKTLYEDRYDGTQSGLVKFRKDIENACGLKGHDWILQVQDEHNNWLIIEKGSQLDTFLERGKVVVKIEDLSKSPKPKKAPKSPRQMEEATPEKKSKKEKKNESSSDDSDGCSCPCWICRGTCKLLCFPFKLVALIIIYAFLFVFWLLALLISIIIEIFWCPFKCICPLCCPCFCCIEEIEKKVFGLFFYVLKAPLKLAKKILS